MCVAEPHTSKVRFFYDFRIGSKWGEAGECAGGCKVRPYILKMSEQQVSAPSALASSD